MATAFEVRTVLRGWDGTYGAKAFLEYRWKGFLYSRGGNYIPNIYSYVDPISAIIMSSILLNERMSFLQIMGGILILGSTFISEIYSQKTIQKESLSQVEITDED